jgi:adenylate cyclase
MTKDTSRLSSAHWSAQSAPSRADRAAAIVRVAHAADGPEATRSTPDEKQIVIQLGRILHSDAFDASARNRTFLRYVVDETLAGRSEYIKGYTVAQQVFQRDADFDPQLDPVVRIEASRLRRSLERYYLTAGKHDRIRIELPKGGYVPWFAVNEDGDPALDPELVEESALSPARGASPFIVVHQFENLGGDACIDHIVRGVTEELIALLTQCNDFAVIAVSTDTRTGSTVDPQTHQGDRFNGYDLKGSVRTSGDRLRISAHVLGISDGRYLWVRSFDRDLRPNDLLALEEEIADAIVTCIAGPEGVISLLSAKQVGAPSRAR